MIRIFTKYLPYRISEQMIIEYDNRIREVNYLLSGNFDFYTPLRGDFKTIELLLSLSIFHKRIITNFESANMFSSRIVLKSDATSIQLGTYDFSAKEIFKLKKTIINFNKLLENYHIPLYLFDYIETKEFLRKVKFFKNYITTEENG